MSLKGIQVNSSGTSKARDTHGKFERKKEINIYYSFHNGIAIELIKFSYDKTQWPFYPSGHDWRCNSATIRKMGFVGKGYDCTSLTSRTGI